MPSVQLYWNDNSTDEDNFILERKIIGGAFAGLATIAADAISYTDETISLDVDYVYRIYAENAGGPSGYSNELPVSVKSIPIRQGVRAIYV